MPREYIDSIRLTRRKAKNSCILKVPKDYCKTIDYGCLKLKRKMRAFLFFW